MRTLKFNVDGMVIKQDPNCDFSDLVPGTEGYITAEFTFSPEWDGYTKVAAFFSLLGAEYTPQPIIDNRCVIPAEALAKRTFKIRVVGGRGNPRMQTLQTNKVEVCQNGGKI